jgi:hypothetical protein
MSAAGSGLITAETSLVARRQPHPRAGRADVTMGIYEVDQLCVYVTNQRMRPDPSHNRRPMPVKRSADSLTTRFIPVLVAFFCALVSVAVLPGAPVLTLAAHLGNAQFLNEPFLNTPVPSIGEQAALVASSGEMGAGIASERDGVPADGVPADTIPEDDRGDDERDTDLEDEPSSEQDDAVWWQGLAAFGPSGVTLLSFHHTSSGRSAIRARVPRPS